MSKPLKNTFVQNRGLVTQLPVLLAPLDEVELKALGGDLPEGTIMGYVTTEDRDSYDHVVLADAFLESIREKGISGPTGVKLLLDHMPSKMAGVIKALEPRPRGLWMHAELNLKVSYVRDAYEAAKMNGGVNFSVGFMVIEYAFKENTETKDEYVEIAKGELLEISLVAIPANAACVMTLIKSRELEDEQQDEMMQTFKSDAEFEKSLVARGLAKSRNDAKRLRELAKQSTELLKLLVTPEVTPPVEPPLLAEKQVDQLSDMIAKMKRIFHP